MQTVVFVVLVPLKHVPSAATVKPELQTEQFEDELGQEIQLGSVQFIHEFPIKLNPGKQT